jgi:hypothetical protein
MRMKNPPRTSVVAWMDENQNQQLGNDQGDTNERGAFHDPAAKLGIVVGQRWVIIRVIL